MVSMEEAKDSHPSRLIDRSAAWARSVNTCASFRPNLRFVAVACLAYLNTYRYVLARLFPSPLSPQLARIAAYTRRRYVRACVFERARRTRGLRAEWPFFSKFRIYDGSRVCGKSLIWKSVFFFVDPLPFSLINRYSRESKETKEENKDVLNRNYEGTNYTLSS